MEMSLSNGFCEMSQNQMEDVDGGMFGFAWLTGALLIKIFAGGVTLGGVGAAAYFGNK